MCARIDAERAYLDGLSTEAIDVQGANRLILRQYVLMPVSSNKGGNTAVLVSYLVAVPPGPVSW
jgi:hypothetical protein